MKMEQATYTREEVRELIAKAIKHDREFTVQLLRGAPLIMDGNVKQGWIENPSSLARQLEGLVPPEELEEKRKAATPPPVILRSVSKGKKITIPACTGTRTIADSSSVFMGYLDPAFGKLSKRGAETPATEVEMYEMVKDAKFSEMFGSLSTDLDRLIFTEDQVVTFVEKHRNWLPPRGDYGAFFLLNEEGHFFVASVCFHDRVGLRGVLLGDFGDDRLGVNLCVFEDDRSWGGSWNSDYCERVVVPLLH